MTYWMFKEYDADCSTSETIFLNAAGLLRGIGSKEVTITSSNDVIIQVGSNVINSSGGWDDHREINAAIENIVIKGVNGDETAVMLTDVCGCQIRNVAIENVDTGIHLTTTTNNEIGCEGTLIEHVRMNDVGMGILFAEGDGTNHYDHTHLEDVGIALKNTSNLRGIEIGNGCKLSSSFIKANVWSTQSCTGMYLGNDMEMHTGIINFNHEKTTAGASGIGIDFATDATVANNHDFWNASYEGETCNGCFLVCGGISTPLNNPPQGTEITYKEY